MGSHTAFRLLACAALALFPVSFASPVRSSQLTALQSRKIDSWNDCSSDQQTKLEQDFKDAAMFADYAANNLKRESKA